jgi:hypothetical protein
MRRLITVASCVLLFFTAAASISASCPGWLGPHNEQGPGCPNIFKSQWDTLFWWHQEIEVQTYGRGACYGALQCWPNFNQPHFEAAGSDSTYNYSYVIERSADPPTDKG